MTTRLLFRRFTTVAIGVCKIASKEARRAGRGEIESEHLLIGLTEARRRVGLVVLERIGITPPMIRAGLATVVKPCTNPTTKRKSSWGASGTKVIDYTVDESRRLGHDWVGSEHLLLGMLRETKGIAARVLTDLGVSLERAREETLKLLEPSPCNPPNDL